ncbi:hypothetical protein ANN_26938 [Periplaneta americana]|uniref:Uncharacterized protein n=1 Tax=Periplaneta americana TaxID=6978 RepID=A0ABQ8RWN6_PERAM|nr:hypothetical protein ANN_26938 [Periplaneta americana]
MLSELANLVKDSMRDAIVSELKAALDRNSALIEKLETALKVKDEKISVLEVKLEEKHDCLEQYQRHQYLCILGVPESEGEDTDAIAVDVAAQIGVELEVHDIDRSHRVRRRGERPRPVIVKFVSYRKRREVFLNEKKLKGKPITIREDLTQARHKLLRQYIDKYGVTSVWTIDGNIFVKIGEVKR